MALRTVFLVAFLPAFLPLVAVFLTAFLATFLGAVFLGPATLATFLVMRATLRLGTEVGVAAGAPPPTSDPVA